MSFDNSMLIREQARQLFQSSPSSTAVQLFVAAFFYTVFDEALDTQLLTLWCIVISFFAISRLVLTWMYKKKKPKDVKPWLNAFTFFTLLIGMTWAFFCSFYLITDDEGFKYVFIVITCGVISAAVPVLAAWTPAYFANTAPQFIVLLSILLYSASSATFYLAVSLIMFYAMLVSLQRQANRTIRNAFILQHRNDELVSELNHEAEKREQVIEERTREIRESQMAGGIGTWEADFITNKEVWSEAVTSQLGFPELAEPTWDDFLGTIHPEDRGYVSESIRLHIEESQELDVDYRIIDTQGKIRWMRSIGIATLDEDGSPIKMRGTVQEITGQKKAEEELQLSYRVFTDTHEGITVTDANRTIVHVNPAFSKITGYSRKEVIGQNPRILSSGKQSPEFYQKMWQQIDEQGHWQGEIWNRRKSGEVYAELLTISSLTDTNNNVVNYVGMFTDITQSKQQQDELKKMAHYDVLTGLPNRALFTDRFQQAIAHSKRTESLLAVCFLDLDDFKPVNDNFGHDVGDELLIEVAERIKACVREEDTVSRQGGDEFALLLSNIVSYAQCEQTMDRVHHSLSQPYIINGNSHHVTASSGITIYPLDDGDADTLLRHADHAMYEAKQTGRNRYHLFNAEQDKETVHKHHRLAEIEQALINDELCLYYQPKVNMVTGKVFGAEALIRWLHPETGLIPPLDFLPHIDGTGLEVRIGNWVINEAITQLEQWQQSGIELEVSINVSSHHLLSEGFYNQLRDALAKHPTVDSKWLQIEILESSVLGDLDTITQIVKTCQEGLGIRFALDDFGTGYSSLSHLKSLPADTVKIDQTFIRDILDDPSDYAIIDGVIGLADSFNRDVIAEGVETTEHGLLLLTMGCEEAQGYGVARPMPANEIPHWLVEYTANKDWLVSGRKDRTVKENKLELFKLTSQKWQDHFVSNIQSSPDDIEFWPIMDNKSCHCGHWIKRAKQEQLFKSGCLVDLSKSHKKIHILAHDLLSKYQNGELDTARAGLPELQIAFNEMNKVLGKCE